MSDQAPTIPTALVAHRLPRRLRIRVPSQKGNRDYFSTLVEKFARDQEFSRIEANAMTASVCFEGEDLDTSAVRAYAEQHHLFRLENPGSNPGQQPAFLAQSVTEPLNLLSDRVKALTGGKLDLPNAVFLVLLGTGLYQILRGNFGAPPWYTAFWYATGIYTKSLIDKGNRATPAQKQAGPGLS